jgi:Transcriptional regulator
MPTELFFTIDPDKRNRIITASLKEFSSHLYHEASINQIIQEADISRGSFYKYFEDKDDLYFFIINQIISTTAHAFLKDYIKTQPVDVFSVFKALFVYNLSLVSEGKYQAFFENLYLGMNYKLQQKLKIIFDKLRKELLEEQMNNIMNASGYEKKYFLELMNIVELINRDLLTIKIANHLDDQKILETYHIRMQVLCEGALHEKDRSVKR